MVFVEKDFREILLSGIWLVVFIVAFVGIGVLIGEGLWLIFHNSDDEIVSTKSGSVQTQISLKPVDYTKLSGADLEEVTYHPKAKDPREMQEELSMLLMGGNDLILLDKDKFEIWAAERDARVIANTIETLLALKVFSEEDLSKVQISEDVMAILNTKSLSSPTYHSTDIFLLSETEFLKLKEIFYAGIAGGAIVMWERVKRGDLIPIRSEAFFHWLRKRDKRTVARIVSELREVGFIDQDYIAANILSRVFDISASDVKTMDLSFKPNEGPSSELTFSSASFLKEGNLPAPDVENEEAFGAD